MLSSAKRFVPLLVCAVAIAACTSDQPKTEAPKAAPSKAEKPKEKAADTAVPSTTVPETPADVAAPPADAEKSATGLASKVIKKGDGNEKPGPTDRVTVHYAGWTTDGKLFDSSYKRGQPATFGLNQVIKGWTEGLQLMVAGEKRRFWIPAELAYGEKPRRPGAPAGQLTFDVELITVLSAPKAPADVAAPPANATKTSSGLAYVVLDDKTKGDGKSPSKSDYVEVHYSGWTKDGAMFDSSVMRGQPARFPVGGVIAGWQEGLQLMKVGQKFRFWIPGDLAYGDNPRPGAPAGQLTFDVELLSIK